MIMDNTQTHMHMVKIADDEESAARVDDKRIRDGDYYEHLSI